MPRANLTWAITHPCYDMWRGGYRCECGHKSPKLREHNSHVIRMHKDDPELVKRVVSWKQWEKWSKKYGW